MMRVAAIGLVAAFFSLSTSLLAVADPIRVTGGSILVTGNSESGSASLTGTRGFTVDGSVDPGETQVDPINRCGWSEGCDPGSTISLTAVFADFSFPNGVATLDGHVYEPLGGFTSPASIFLHVTGPSFLLQAGDGEPFVRTERFSIVEGQFLRPGAVPELISGAGGTVAIWFVPAEHVPGNWVLDQVRYDFADVAAVPEPGTFLLLATGALGIARRMRRVK